MANESVGALDFLHMYSETTWNTKPGSPTYVPVPVDSYSGRFTPENRQATPLVGIFSRKYNRNFRGRVAGAFACPFWTYHLASAGNVSLMEYICKWAFAYDTPEAAATPSKGMEWKGGENGWSREHNGVVCDQATIAADESSGMVNFNANILGARESVVAVAQVPPTDFEGLPHAEFADCTLKFDGGSLFNFGGFQFVQSNGQMMKFLNSSTPLLNRRTDRNMTLQVTKPKEDDSWDDRVRALGSDEHTAELTIRGLNMLTAGSGNPWTQLKLTFNRLSLVDAPEQWNRQDITYDQINFMVLKPDSSTVAVDFAWTAGA